MKKNIVSVMLMCLFLFSACAGESSSYKTSDVSGSSESVLSASDGMTYTELNEILPIYAIYATKPNSADGVSVCAIYDYVGEDDIKYLYFELTPYNAVDDPVQSEIDGSTTATCKITGPISKSEDNYAEFENVWYNSTIEYIAINSITVELMNGETLVCNKDIPVDKRENKA